MRKFIFLFITILSFCAVSKAQNTFISAEEKFNFQNDNFDLIGRIGDKIYAYQSTSKGYFLKAYNDSMRLVSIVALDFFPKKIEEAQFFISNNNILAFFNAEESGSFIQYAALLDDKARLITKPKAVDSSRKSWLGERSNVWVITASSDKSKYSIVKLRNNSVVRDVSVKLLDDKLNTISKRNMVLHNEAQLQFRQIELANNGIVFLLAETNNRYASKDVNVALFSLDLEKGVAQKKLVNVDDAHATGTHIKLDRKTDVCYLAGFLSEKKASSIGSVFYGVYDSETKDAIQLYITPFSDLIRKEAMASNKRKPFDNYTIEDIIIKNNGGIIAIAEANSIVTRSNYSNGYGNFYSPFYSIPMDAGTIEYRYGDLMILDLDNNGKQGWHSFVHKEQVTQDDGGAFSSYGMLNSGGSLVFIFNDYLRANSGVQMAAIDIDGALQMQRIDTQDNLSIIARLAQQTGSREMVMPYVKRGSMGLLRLAF